MTIGFTELSTAIAVLMVDLNKIRPEYERNPLIISVSEVTVFVNRKAFHQASIQHLPFTFRDTEMESGHRLKWIGMSSAQRNSRNCGINVISAFSPPSQFSNRIRSLIVSVLFPVIFLVN